MLSNMQRRTAMREQAVKAFALGKLEYSTVPKIPRPAHAWPFASTPRLGVPIERKHAFSVQMGVAFRTPRAAIAARSCPGLACPAPSGRNAVGDKSQLGAGRRSMVTSLIPVHFA